MRHFTCYVQYSRAETFGLPVIEALSLGVPVIVASRDALIEIVRNGKNGLVIPFGKPEVLADAIARLLTDDELARRLGEAGREAATRRFIEKLVVDRIENIYTKAVVMRRFKRKIAQ